MSRTVVLPVVALVLFIAVLQVLPFGGERTNPPVTAEPQWDSLRTHELAVQACFACHSNQTDWPWYSDIAPFSWKVRGDVDAGRALLNFSAWDRPQPGAGAAVGSIVEGHMPSNAYVLLNPAAGFEPAEQKDLIRGLRATPGEFDAAGD
ncbi:MAG: heme-binding domain-containing protein [Chloroflexota bacterium]|jgi:hypothetical protein|nr:heme-binding domain-containing protein [Chloroflexota bacterium]MDP6508252.1 heme-binding domain-containing protein [Chloroflexota bacterium]MDP6757089.1 heme-binding domain-containing protein [Chloroflexota bacterium]